MQYTSRVTDRGYGRISLDTLRSGSISKQHERISAFAGPDLVWYADESVSGSKIPFAQRPEGARLLRDLQPGDRVLITKIDRAARSVRDLLNLMETIEAARASVVFVDQNIDTSGPMGRFILTLLGAIAELEAAIIAERRKESLESFTREGRHAVGKAPLGFRSIENPNGRGLVIAQDPETAPLVREAIMRVMAGESQAKVRHSLGMSKTGFHKLLHNPRLAGMTPDGDGVVMIDGTPRVNPDAAILSMAEWMRLQDYLRKDKPKTWSKAEGYGPALTCSVCGGRLYINKSTRKPEYATYRCNKVKHQPGEPSASIIARRANEYVEEVFLREHGNRPYKVTYWAEGGDARGDAIAQAQVALEETQRRLLASTSAEEDETLTLALLEARRALREAEAMPDDRVLVTTDSGRTYADLWHESKDDHDRRCTLLKSVGVWLVEPGRLPIEEKVRLALPGVNAY